MSESRRFESVTEPAVHPTAPALAGNGSQAGRGRSLAASTLVAFARRLLGAVVTLVVSSFVIYSAQFLTGNPINLWTGGRILPKPALDAISKQAHLDKHWPVGYFYWVNDLLHGNLGTSGVYHQGVGPLLAPRLETSLYLIAYASILTLGVGVLLSIAIGLSGRRLRVLLTAASALGMGIPGFVAASVLVTVFSIRLGWFPATGSGSGFGDRIWHLTLPAVALCVSGVAYVARIGSAAIRSEATMDYVTTATARGLPRSRVVRRHILRNALIPITTVSGLTVAGLFAGTAVVEFAFQVNGVGNFLISSVNAHDYAVVQAICLAIVGAFLLVNIVVDALYGVLDPRIRRR